MLGTNGCSRSLIAALVLGAGAQAQAEGGAGRLLERSALLRARPPAVVAAAASPAALAAADKVKPKLTVFDAGTTWSMKAGAVPLAILVKATDELSGVARIVIGALGPSGQVMFGVAVFDYPVLSLSRRIPLNMLFDGRLLEPGAWTIGAVSLEDAAGNSREVEGAALAALGNLDFTVVNTGGVDNVAPTLTSGKLIKTSVSLSASAPGTTQAPFVGVKLGAADSGASALAGIAWVGATLCLADESRCLELLQATPLGGGSGAATVVVGRQVSPAFGDQPGAYVLHEVLLIDHAGNVRVLTNTAFGGETDFAALFGATTLTLKP